MNIAIIGNGGREHAIAKIINKSKKISKVFCIPGNAGTSELGINLDIDFLDTSLLLKTLKINNIKFVIIGPEKPLVDGLGDYLRNHNIKVFGPNRYAAQLEGSKAFMKKLCKKNNIPTANFKICQKRKEILNFLKNSKMPVVVKADGLAAGKGVTICSSARQVIKVSTEIFKGKFKTSNKVVLEEFLKGEEASYFIIVDKKSFSFIGSAQDHKRVGEKETGPNTGGMGAYSPASIINKKVEEKVIKKIIKPTLLALKKKAKPYTGFLYVGLMIKNNEPYLIEYNVRMGDPECQVILPRLKTSLFDIIEASTENKLNKIKIKWKKIKCMTIVLCSRGYPGNYKKRSIIKNLDKIRLDKKSIIFHAGTKKEKNKFFSNGGRVLNITCLGNNFKKIRKNIIKIIKKINWKDGFFRKDIGWRIIKKI
tara:strand:+ start:132 stop:1400 length:1269 start_codon:yes stop_codon:yes gene_type:complete